MDYEKVIMLLCYLICTGIGWLQLSFVLLMGMSHRIKAVQKATIDDVITKGIGFYARLHDVDETL